MKEHISAVETSIANLVLEFIKNPKRFENEKLLHYEFHDILCGKTSLKTRWEYPTNDFHVRNGGSLELDNESNYNARFDLALIEEESKDEVPFAFEFKLDVDNGIKNITKDSFRKHTKTITKN